MSGWRLIVLDEDEQKDRLRPWSADLRRVGGLALVIAVVAASAAPGWRDRSSTTPSSALVAGAGCVPRGLSSPTGLMTVARSGHSATLLRSGRVLVAGGWVTLAPLGVTGSAELYDPNTGSWSSTGSMKSARAFHAAALLPSGKVLVAGGRAPRVIGEGAVSTASAEVYDPDTGTWTETGTMQFAHDSFAAIVLRSGEVFVTPGFASQADSAELYDPVSGTWSALDGPALRPSGSATLLGSGKVLIAGGLAGAQLYDPPTNAWRPTSNMITTRDWYTATVLPSGKVLVAGGDELRGPYRPTSSAEIYDPTTGAWTPTKSMTAEHAGATAVLLPFGMVLVAGGGSVPEKLGAVNSVDLYDPAAGAWTAPGVMAAPRSYFTATLLRTGGLLFAGGENERGVQYASAEIYALRCNWR